jgi:ABC-type antimicrobial peptide transport system permease subunit
VRVALGANPRAVIALVMREATWLIARALLIGVPLAWGLSRLVATQFYRVPPTDFVTTTGVMGLLSAIAWIAGYLPARKATRVDPIEVLRAE